MKAIAAVVPAILIAACTSTGGTSSMMASSSTRYWTGVSDSVDAFKHDNVVCSARASKFGNVASSAAPDNRIDRPMQKWPNDVAQETYEQCMHDVGWRSTAG